MCNEVATPNRTNSDRHGLGAMCSQAAQDTKKRPAAAVASPSGLPEGWTETMKVRKTGASAGATDKYYQGPGGLKARSFKEAWEKASAAE